MLCPVTLCCDPVDTWREKKEGEEEEKRKFFFLFFKCNTKRMQIERPSAVSCTSAQGLAGSLVRGSDSLVRGSGSLVRGSGRFPVQVF